MASSATVAKPSTISMRLRDMATEKRAGDPSTYTGDHDEYDQDVHPLPPITLRGTLIAIEPLQATHAPGLLAAADSDEVFAWLPYQRPRDLADASRWIAAALAERDAHRREPFAILDATDQTVIGSTSYWDY